MKVRQRIKRVLHQTHHDIKKKLRQRAQLAHHVTGDTWAELITKNLHSQREQLPRQEYANRLIQQNSNRRN